MSGEGRKISIGRQYEVLFGIEGGNTVNPRLVHYYMRNGNAPAFTRAEAASIVYPLSMDDFNDFYSIMTASDEIVSRWIKGFISRSPVRQNG